jgi:hypothetical protein
MHKSHKYKRSCKSLPLRDALDDFFTRHKGRANFHVAHLWDNWNMVMGEYLSKAALPLGAQDGTLLIGAEDNMLMHELSFHIPEILSRANAFMREKYFNKVLLSPVRGRTPLYPPQPRQTYRQAPLERPRPEKLGKLLGILDQSSAVGRAYASYVKFFEE